MSKSPRVVAELGRPETPAETSARKAASSHAYRSSKTFRNLIAAMLATVAIVFVIVLIVPRGDFGAPEPVDVAASAAAVSADLGRPVITPIVPDDWRANSARMEGDMWRVVYAPEADYVRVAQGFDTDELWASRRLGGFAPTGTVVIDGITWDEYTSAGDYSYALSTPAGDDTVLIYGKTDAETAAIAAEGVADQIRDMNEETP